MKQNVGSIDRIIRIVAGAAIITWGITTQNWLGVIGIIPLMTGSSGGALHTVRLVFLR